MLNVYKRWLPADIIACPFLIDSKVVSPLHLKPKWQNIGLQPPLKIILTVQRMCVLISSSKLLALDVKLNCLWQFLLLIAHLGRQWMAKQNHIITFFNLLHAKKTSQIMWNHDRTISAINVISYVWFQSEHSTKCC